MKNEFRELQRLLMEDISEKELSPKQKKIAKLDPPVDKIDAGDFAKLRAGAKVKEEGYMGTKYDSSEDMAVDMIKKGITREDQYGDWNQIYDQGFASGYDAGWEDGSRGKENMNPKSAARFKYGQDQFSENQDHEVSMANNSIETIIKAAMELKAKLGNDEKNIPAWIQDHIAKAEDMITQASQNYHEYGDEEVEDVPVNGAIEDEEEMSLQKMMEKIIK